MNCKYLYIIILTFSSLIYSQCDNYDIGDANNDNFLDIIDVIIYVDVIFQEEVSNIEFMDLNFDLIINIFDIVILIERILNEYPSEIQILNIEFNFHQLEVVWETSSDYGFESYNLYYANFIDNQESIIYSTDNINDTSIIIDNIILNEQNYFWIGVKDFTGCELFGSQLIYELPYKSYTLDDNGYLINSEFTIENFKPSEQCASCHTDHYNEWFSSMHSYTMRSPLFFSYKEEAKESHGDTAERFCMQCHNPVSFLTGFDLSDYNNPEDFQSSEIDQVLKDGIGCDVCHTVTGISQTVYTDDNITSSATYKMYPLGNIKFGPIINPETNEFHDSYYLPTYQSSQMCLPCHDLVVGDIEAEITFSEWSRIPGFSMFGGVSCQECHMPLKDNGYHSHKFVGVDIDLSIPMEESPLYHDVSELLSTAAQVSFSISGDTLQESISQGDTLQIPLTVKSLTAHSLPSGTSFNREAWVELIIYNNSDIIFSSGNISNIENLDILDENLLLFTSYLYDSENNLTNDITNISNMDNFSLSAYQERYKYYNVVIPDNLTDSIEVSARLLFRPFKPDFLIQHHPDFLNNLPIFEISKISSVIILEE